MKTADNFRHELRRLQAIRYATRIRRELKLTPDDPDLRWALRELRATLSTRARSGPGASLND